MFKYLVVLLCLAVAGASLGAMGVRGRAMAELLLALGLVVGTSLLIAWPFLRRPCPPDGRGRSAGKNGWLTRRLRTAGHAGAASPNTKNG